MRTRATVVFFKPIWLLSETILNIFMHEFEHMSSNEDLILVHYRNKEINISEKLDAKPSRFSQWDVLKDENFLKITTFPYT